MRALPTVAGIAICVAMGLVVGGDFPPEIRILAAGVWAGITYAAGLGART